MKTSVRLFIFFAIAIAFSLQSCKTEEEKQVDRRIETLDVYLDSNRAQLHSFFSALEKQGEIIKNQRFDNLMEMNPSDTFLLSIMKSEYTKASLKSRDLPYTMENSIIYQPIEKHQNLSSQFQYLKTKSEEYYTRNIYERYMGEEWHIDISSPSSWESEEKRDEVMNEFISNIDLFSNAVYLIGIDELYLKPATIIDEKNFESGEMLARIYVMEISTKDVIQSFLVRAENGMFVMTYNADDPEAMQRQLTQELRQSLVNNLKVIWSEF